MANRYTVRVHRIEELLVEVEANSLEDARFFVDSQQGTKIRYRPDHGHGIVAARINPSSPVKYKMVGTAVWPVEKK